MATSITQRIPNILRLALTVKSGDEIDLTNASDIEVYIKQTSSSSEYRYEDAVAVSANEIEVLVPQEDALTLRIGACKIQVAWTENGAVRKTEVKTVPVSEFIWEDGYNA